MAGTTALLALSCNLALLAGIVIFDIDLVNSEIQLHHTKRNDCHFTMCSVHDCHCTTICAEFKNDLKFAVVTIGTLVQFYLVPC